MSVLYNRLSWAWPTCPEQAVAKLRREGSMQIDAEWRVGSGRPRPLYACSGVKIETIRINERATTLLAEMFRSIYD